MRISSGVVAALAIAAAGVAWAGEGVKYASPQAAFEQGLGAYKSGYYEIAIPAGPGDPRRRDRKGRQDPARYPHSRQLPCSRQRG